MWLSAGSNAENLAVADGSHNIFRKNLASLSWDRIFVAATRAEMEQLRSDFRVYGEVGWGWKPYSSEAPAGIFAQKISLTEGFRYQASQIGDDLMQRLEEADRSNTIVIIVVDPWSLRLPKYADFMSDYDKRAFLNCGVIILWDAKDDETTAHRAALEQTVLRTFSRLVLSNAPQFFRPNVQSAEEFERALSQMLTALRSKIIERASLLRPIEGEQINKPSIIKPIIGGLGRDG